MNKRTLYNLISLINKSDDWITASLSDIPQWNQMHKNASRVPTDHGITTTVNSNGTFTFNGTASGTFNLPLNNYQSYPLNYISSHRYLFLLSGMEGGSSSTYNLRYNSSGLGINKSQVFYGSQLTNAYPRFIIQNGITVSNLTISVNIIDLTQMFGTDNIPSLAELEILFPNHPYDYKYPSANYNGTTKYEYEAVNLSDNKYKYKGTTEKLPDEYQEVEYLESTGEQFILPNYTPEDGCTVFINRMEFTENPPLTYYFGCWESTDERMFCYISSAGKLAGGYANGAWASTIDVPINQIFNIYSLFGIYSDYSYKQYFNGIEILSKTTSKRITENTLPVYVFWRNYPGTTAYKMKGRMGSVEICNKSNVLMRNLIPCYRKSDNKPGMYDLVGNVFYINANSSATTDFVVGPKV